MAYRHSQDCAVLNLESCDCNYAGAGTTTVPDDDVEE